MHFVRMTARKLGESGAYGFKITFRCTHSTAVFETTLEPGEHPEYVAEALEEIAEMIRKRERCDQKFIKEAS